MRGQRERSVEDAGRTSAILAGAVVAMDIRTLSQQAETIALGGVVDRGAVGITEFPPLGRNITYTDYRLAVQRFLKNGLEYGHLKEIIVRVLGGAMEELSVDVLDEPDFFPTEGVLLFLSKDTGGVFELGEDCFTVLGAFQGKYSIILEDGQLMVTRAGEERFRLEALMSEIQKSLG